MTPTSMTLTPGGRGKTRVRLGDADYLELCAIVDLTRAGWSDEQLCAHFGFTPRTLRRRRREIRQFAVHHREHDP